MRHWRIHLGWAIVTIVAAGAWGRIVAPRPAEPAPPSPPVMPVPPAVPRDGPPPAAIVPAAEQAPAPPSEEQAIRALLGGRDTWLQGIRRLLAQPDAALKIALLTELSGKGETSIRYQAIRELVQLRGRDAVPMLMDLLRREDEDASLRALSARWLGTLSAVESTDALLRAFRAKEEYLRLDAANALQKLGVPAPAREVLDACAREYESPDSGVRRKAVESAGNIEHASMLPLLTRALRDSSGDVRMEAVSAITYGFPSQALALIEPLTRDPNPEVAEAAQEALTALTHKRD